MRPLCKVSLCFKGLGKKTATRQMIDVRNQAACCCGVNKTDPFQIMHQSVEIHQYAQSVCIFQPPNPLFQSVFKQKYLSSLIMDLRLMKYLCVCMHSAKLILKCTMPQNVEQFMQYSNLIFFLFSNVIFVNIRFYTICAVIAMIDYLLLKITILMNVKEHPFRSLPCKEQRTVVWASLCTYF